MRSVQDNVTPKDHFHIYGENVASRMRLANRSSTEVAIAKNQIDNILFQLEIGLLSSSGMYIYAQNPSSLNNSSPSNSSCHSTNLSNPQSPTGEPSYLLTELSEFISPKK